MTSTETGNRLPPGQEPIRTRNVMYFIAMADLLSNTTDVPATIGIVTGVPGTGKTMAAHLYLTGRGQRRPSPPMPCILVDVVPQVTTKDLLYTITSRISGRPGSRTSHEAFQQVLMALGQSHMRLLVLDNADYLRHEHLELLHALVEQTTCSILLIGHPRLLEVIKHTSLVAHVGPVLQFRPIPEEELFTSFLPQLALPGWAFDPHDEADRRLGTYLWRNARPSLRRLCMILSYASQLAQMQGQATITLETIRLALQMMAPQDHPSDAQSEEEDA